MTTQCYFAFLHDLPQRNAPPRNVQRKAFSRLDLVKSITKEMHDALMSPPMILAIVLLATQKDGMTATAFRKASGLHEACTRRALKALVDMGYATMSRLATRHHRWGAQPLHFQITSEGVKAVKKILQL